MLFKVLDNDLTSYHGGNCQWILGEWMPPVKDLMPCRRGYHICDGYSQLLEWLGPTICEVEVRGKQIKCDDKLVVEEARIIRIFDTWDERTARLFACDCAEHVLYIYEQYYPNDSRPRDAINTVRRYANGKATLDEMKSAYSAAHSAAHSAANSEAHSAAYSAAYSAANYAANYAANSAAHYAAHSAAHYAAYSAPRFAVYSAAYSTECDWQLAKLEEYLNAVQGS